MLMIFPTRIAFYYQKSIKSGTPFSVSFCCHGNCLLIQDQKSSDVYYWILLWILFILTGEIFAMGNLSEPLTELCHFPTAI